MSVTKNTAARFAMERELALGRFQQTFLVTLDCDKVMAAAYPRRLAEQMAVGYQPGLVVWRARTSQGGQGGTCGRIGVWMRDGHHVGMYDEEPDILGSGSQDIDFMDRMELLGGRRHAVPQIDVGIAIKNELGGDFAENWSVAKIKNCNPEDVTKYKTWGLFNAHNSKAFAQKKKSRDAIRNDQRFGAMFRWRFPALPPNLVAPAFGESRSMQHAFYVQQVLSLLCSRCGARWLDDEWQWHWSEAASAFLCRRARKRWRARRTRQRRRAASHQRRPAASAFPCQRAHKRWRGRRPCQRRRAASAFPCRRARKRWRARRPRP